MRTDGQTERYQHTANKTGQIKIAVQSSQSTSNSMRTDGQTERYQHTANKFGQIKIAVTEVSIYR